jgi:hypothetical protein
MGPEQRNISLLLLEIYNAVILGTRLVGQVKSVRFLTPEIAVMHAVGGTVMRGKTNPSPERDSIQTFIAIKRSGEWGLAAFQNTRVRPMGRNAGALWSGWYRIGYGSCFVQGDTNLVFVTSLACHLTFGCTTRFASLAACEPWRWAACVA